MVVVPRRCAGQTLCNNIPGETPTEYWKCAVFIHFLDHMIAQLEDRFSEMASNPVEGFLLLPSCLAGLMGEKAKQLFSNFSADLPSPETFT